MFTFGITHTKGTPMLLQHRVPLPRFLGGVVCEGCESCLYNSGEAYMDNAATSLGLQPLQGLTVCTAYYNTSSVLVDGYYKRLVYAACTMQTGGPCTRWRSYTSVLSYSDG